MTSGGGRVHDESRGTETDSSRGEYIGDGCDGCYGRDDAEGGGDGVIG
jgi:hypothetical protein